MRDATRRKLSLIALAGGVAVVLGDSPAPEAVCAAYEVASVAFSFVTDCPGAPPTGVVRWSYPRAGAGDGGDPGDVGRVLASQARAAGLDLGVAVTWTTSACATTGGDCSHTDPAGAATAAGLVLSWSDTGAALCSAWQGDWMTDQALSCPVIPGTAQDAGIAATDGATATRDASSDADAGAPDLAAPSPVQRQCSLRLTRVP